MKCSACRMEAHPNCISFIHKTSLPCKPSFEASIHQNGETSINHHPDQEDKFHVHTTGHHWIHRRKVKGSCEECGKVSTKNCFYFGYDHLLSYFMFEKKVNFFWRSTKTILAKSTNLGN